MKCESVHILLEQLCRNQLLDTNLRLRALEHARDCRVCGVYLANQRMLSAGLSLLRADLQDGESVRAVPSPNVEAAVLGAYESNFERKRKVVALRSAVAAMAACLVVVAFIRAPHFGGQTRGRAAPASEQFISGASLFLTDLPSDGGAQNRFINLPFAEVLGAEERTELQRVRVTRGELAAMGLPGADAPDPEEPVNAEIVVGEDGVPRAVRLLN